MNARLLNENNTTFEWLILGDYDRQCGYSPRSRACAVLDFGKPISPILAIDIIHEICISSGGIARPYP